MSVEICITALSHNRLGPLPKAADPYRGVAALLDRDSTPKGVVVSRL